MVICVAQRMIMLNRMRAIAILFVFVSSAALAAEAAAREETTKVPAHPTLIMDGLRTIEVVDLCPQFLDLYKAAMGTDPATRWKPWGERYGFAAVPPALLVF
jgi:hypothetical protein